MCRINQDQFDKTLAWLSSDREAAGRKYEDIRERLIRIFTWRGCTDAEELADEVVNRVMLRIEDLLKSYTGDPARYFYGVAKKLVLEHQRSQKQREPLREIAVDRNYLSEQQATMEIVHECLARCMKELDPEDSSLIMAYYSGDKQEKINNRKGLAWRFGVAANTLRVRVFRIRETLEKCIKRCLEPTL